MCWYEGLSDWQPLNSVISFAGRFDQPAHVPNSLAANPSIIQTNVKQGAIIGGVICFVIGIILMILTMWSFFIYGPLFLVAFILSIVAMSQKRILGGILLLLATLIVPTLLGLYLFTTRTTEALTADFASSAPSFPKMTDQSQQDNRPEASAVSSSGNFADTQPALSTPNTETAMIEQSPAKNAELDAKMGFSNYKLGTPIADFKSDDIEAAWQALSNKADVKPYYARNFDTKLGAAEIDMIRLNFDEDFLVSVTVFVKGEKNSLALREMLIAGYGQPSKTNVIPKMLIWEGDDCILSFTGESSMGEYADAEFTSKSVDKRLKEIKLKKAKEDAASGAGAL